MFIKTRKSTSLETNKKNSFNILQQLLFLAIFLIASAISFPAFAQQDSSKGSYNFDISNSELDSAEARLRALEAQLLEANPAIRKELSKTSSSTTVSSTANVDLQSSQLAASQTATTRAAGNTFDTSGNSQEGLIDLKLQIQKRDLLVSDLKSQINEQKFTIENLKTQVDSLQLAKKTSGESGSAQVEILRNQIMELKALNQRLVDDTSSLGIGEIEAKDQEIANLKDQVKKLNSMIHSRSNLSSEKARLEKQLVIAETEIERLSSILEDHNRSVLGLKPKEYDRSLGESKTERIAKTSNHLVESDLPVITVAVDKANLRTGPGKNHSPLMELARGSRLVVEKRQGEWIRVIAPNGVRAWISSTIVSFGDGNSASQSRTVNIKAYDQDVENKALKLIQRQ